VQRTRAPLRDLLNSLLSGDWRGGLVVTGLAGDRADSSPKPWYKPHYLIPLLGMVLGNTLNGHLPGLDRFMEGVAQAAAIGWRRALASATRLEACQEVVRDANPRGDDSPPSNSMMCGW